MRRVGVGGFGESESQVSSAASTSGVVEPSTTHVDKQLANDNQLTRPAYEQHRPRIGTGHILA